MDRQQRRAARAEFLDRDQDAGIYALRFRDAVFVGAAPRLAAAENRLRFTLRQGGERNGALAAAWAAEGDFRFEILEAFDPELSPMRRRDLLKERLVAWRDKTGGTVI